MKKLVCDRCGRELTDKDSIDLALEGKNAWADATRARGAQPRGILPCEHYIRCGGEMIVADDKATRGHRGLFQRLHQKKEPSGRKDKTG